ncbi:hypothetical protein GUJ93_ZPchr0012g20951 [Zizania palustris]|uniref:Alkyl transferase n=1 Tax=Zizania palustris TaxID=103762 RepID=A0A8J5WRU6_ZIZPA|nr:hypothetical protein GUJ93_ZPchr0012g20951 [Zizania palustris]
MLLSFRAQSSKLSELSCLLLGAWSLWVNLQLAIAKIQAIRFKELHGPAQGSSSAPEERGKHAAGDRPPARLSTSWGREAVRRFPAAETQPNLLHTRRRSRRPFGAATFFLRPRARARRGSAKSPAELIFTTPLDSRRPATQNPKMEKPDELIATGVLASLQNFIRKCIIAVISYGPMPKHIAFIMDGNRRYAKFRSIKEGSGHRLGFSALIASLLYCYEMGVEYITVYAFSIDNFKRDPTEVQSLMELMEEKINELLENTSVINKVNCKMNFWGNLDLLSEPVRLAAQKLMASTAENKGLVLSVCMPYNSTSEIVNAVNQLCAERREHAGNCNGNSPNNGVVHSDVSVEDLDRHMYSTGCPDPDIVIRTSGETRLSNFLLWQTTFSHLQNPDPLWPEFSFRHLVWAILQYQRVYPYIEQNKRLSKKLL